jgi:copper homeostasis protein
MSNIIIEIATSDYASSAAAASGGADRIELCDNLAEGGTTQSKAIILHCREKLDLQIFPIIRPRGGDFLYTADEFRIMMDDIRTCKELNCDGVVIGILNADGSIDVERSGRMVELAYPMEVTFHRAFDRCKDPFEALEQLINMGCTRILTSGQQPTALEGISLIAQLVKAAEERIIIMPGSGVRKENIAQLIERTGAVEMHSSLRTKVQSKMEFRHPAFGSESYEYFSVKEEDVRALRSALSALSGVEGSKGRA